MRQRPRHRPIMTAPALCAALLLPGLAACSGSPTEVPDDAVAPSSTAAPSQPVVDPSGTSPESPSDEVERLITLCLARYGLGERPVAPDATASEGELALAQQEQARYDATLTDCSAEAMAGIDPGSSTPAS